MSRSWILAIGLIAIAAPAWGADVGSLKKEKEQIAEQIKAKHKLLGEIRQELSKLDSVVKAQLDLSAAYKALQAKEQADQGVQAARKRLEEASKARDAVVKAELAANADGARILKQIEAEEARIRAAADEINKLRGKLFEVRQSLEKSKGSRVATAEEGFRKVLEEMRAAAAKATTAERAAGDKARAALDTRINEVVNANPKAAELKKAIDALHARDAAINKEIRDLENPKPAKKEEAKPKETAKPKAEAKPKTEKPKSDKPKEEAKPKK